MARLPLMGAEGLRGACWRVPAASYKVFESSALETPYVLVKRSVLPPSIMNRALTRVLGSKKTYPQGPNTLIGQVQLPWSLVFR